MITCNCVNVLTNIIGICDVAKIVQSYLSPVSDRDVVLEKFRLDHINEFNVESIGNDRFIKNHVKFTLRLENGDIESKYSIEPTKNHRSARFNIFGPDGKYKSDRILNFLKKDEEYSYFLQMLDNSARNSTHQKILEMIDRCQCQRMNIECKI